MGDYVNPISDGKLSWWSISSYSSDLGEALENYFCRIHEVSMQKCAIITKSMWWVGTNVCDLTTYEGFPNLETFFVEFEEKVFEPHHLLSLDFSLKATPARWWVMHK